MRIVRVSNNSPDLELAATEVPPRVPHTQSCTVIFWSGFREHKPSRLLPTLELT